MMVHGEFLLSDTSSSKLTEIPLNSEVSGTGTIKSDGSIGSSEYVKEKAIAAAKADCKVFLHNISSSKEQDIFRFIQVSKIDEA